MDINLDTTTIPLNLQQEFSSSTNISHVSESLAKGVPIRGSVSNAESRSAVLEISPEAQTLANTREAEANEEAKFGSRSMLGGLEERTTSAVDKAQNRVNMPLDGGPIVPETIFEQNAAEMIADGNKAKLELAMSGELQNVANEDVLDLHMAMEAAAFQIPPEVNGTLTPQPTGNLAEQDNPSMTPVDPAMSRAEGPSASSVMGMGSVEAMQNELMSPATSLQELEGRRDMVSYGAGGDAPLLNPEQQPAVLATLA